jgi:UDP-N-acetylglucosamine 4,6-dehydratase
MTRFWISLEEGVGLVLTALETMQGGEIYVKKIPSMKVIDLATAIAPDCKQIEVGIRPGEKLHEVMITRADARHTLEFDDYYIIEPEYEWWNKNNYPNGKRVNEDFIYSSDNNTEWLSVEEMRKKLKEL